MEPRVREPLRELPRGPPREHFRELLPREHFREHFRDLIRELLRELLRDTGDRDCAVTSRSWSEAAVAAAEAGADVIRFLVAFPGTLVLLGRNPRSGPLSTTGPAWLERFRGAKRSLAEVEEANLAAFVPKGGIAPMRCPRVPDEADRANDLGAKMVNEDDNLPRG